MMKAYYLGYEIEEIVGYYGDFVVFRAKGDRLASIAFADEIVLEEE